MTGPSSTPQQAKRRLAAVVFTDVVGYSARMQADETATIVRVGEDLSLMRRMCIENSGEFLNSMGDGLMLAFPSAVHAVTYALRVQEVFAVRKSTLPDDLPLEHRIGIHLGDVMSLEDGNVAGDGVNIAARLEAKAPSGGICISQMVYDTVKGMVPMKATFLGREKFKNIAEPIPIYHISTALQREVSAALQEPRIVDGLLRLTRSREWRWAGAGLVAVGLAGIAFWIMPQFWKAAPAPPAMSVAIMPFAAPHGDADASRIADALARDLVTRLGRVEGIEGRVSVISGLSLPAGEIGTIGPRELGRKLDARYLVEGDVLHGSDGNTVNLRLVNTTTGAQVWSERGSLPDSDVTKESSVSLYNLSNRLRQAIVSAEIRRIEGLPVAALSAMELVLRANVMSWDNPTLARLSEARKLIDEALRLEPDLEPAMNAGAINTVYIQEVDPHPDHDRIARDLDHFSARAIHLEPSGAGAWHIRTDALVYLGRWDAALQASDERIRIAPSDPNSYVLRAEVMTSMGRPDEALKLIDRVFAMNPPNRSYPLRAACQAHLLAGQADQAIATCEKQGRRTVLWYALMAAAYANHGDMEKAAAAKAELLKLVPGYTISQLRAKRYSDHPEYVKLAEKYWYAGLRKAGFREN